MGRQLPVPTMDELNRSFEKEIGLLLKLALLNAKYRRMSDAMEEVKKAQRILKWL